MTTPTSTATGTSAPEAPMRAPDVVMRLERMGSFHPCRLSFMRCLLRRWGHEGWCFQRAQWNIDAHGLGHACYSVHNPGDEDGRIYTLVVFAHEAPEVRSDRVIATAWDATFALYDGTPDPHALQELKRNVPLQEAGRISERVLVMGRANRSWRLFEHVVAQLAAGHQPEAELMEDTGYLMRTTAVYGSGKFGAADYESYGTRPEFRVPFQAEMLAVYMFRAFTIELVEHLAQAQSADAARLHNAARLGIGNATGLGMAPFVLHHPVLLHRWMLARERSFARVRGQTEASEAARSTFLDWLRRAAHSIQRWHVDDPTQQARIQRLRADLVAIEVHVAEMTWQDFPWQRLWAWAEDTVSTEAQELLVSLMLEPYGALIDDQSAQMAAPAHWPVIDTQQSLGELKAMIQAHYGFALALDFSDPECTHFAWYTSVEKKEPRLGVRTIVDDYDQPLLSPAREIALLWQALQDISPEQDAGAFLRDHPQHRHSVRRVQLCAAHDYAEIRDNTVGASLRPIDILRCKLSFFGATHFDPRSRRWLRITMFQGAPLPWDLKAHNCDDWTYPTLP